MLTLIRGGKILDPGNIDGMEIYLSKMQKLRTSLYYKGDNPSDAFSGLSIDKVIDATGENGRSGSY